MKAVPLSRFGRDHWSLLALVEHICVENRGCVSDVHRQKFRTNIKRHPGYGYFPLGVSGHQWKYEYGTRLKGFPDSPRSQLATHDDWDCAADLESAGLIKNLRTAMNPVFRLTLLGGVLSNLLRLHKSAGGTFSSFDPLTVNKL